MRSRPSDESDEGPGRRDRQPSHSRRRAEDARNDEVEEEDSEVPRRKTPRTRRRGLETVEDEPDPAPTPQTPWLPPARR